MKRVLVAAIVAAGALLGPASPACACSCAPLTQAQAFEKADAVFAATLVRRDERGGLVRSSTDPVTLTWTVDAVYKGSASKVQQVNTVESGASCGLEAEVGRRYLVHADSTGGRLEASLCGGTRPLAGTPAVAGHVAKPPTGGEPPTVDQAPVPAPERSVVDHSAWWPFAAAGGGVVLSALVVFWILRRRPRGAQGTPAAGAV
jgi:Tissue inhibitor of metalloproteinase